jgi:hypothetical protein
MLSAMLRSSASLLASRSPRSRSCAAFFAAAALALGSLGASQARAQTPLSSSFTYQGALNVSGSAFTGSADFHFRLYDGATGGNQIGGEIDLTGVAVARGVLTAELDFGAAAWNGDNRWLEIDAKPGAAASFTTLTPRQKVTAAPASLYSASPWVRSGMSVTLPSGRVNIVSDDLDPAVGGTALQITSASQPDRQLLMGYDTNSNAGWLGAIWQGFQWRNLSLQPGGGDVGIGTLIPNGRLQVVGARLGWAGVSAGTDDPDVGAVYNTAGWSPTPAFEARAGFLDAPPAVIFHHISHMTMGLVAQNAPRGLRVTGPNNEAAAGLFVDGTMGVGTANPGAFRLAVAGTAANSTGSWSVFSDERLKHGVAALAAGTSLDKLLALRGVSFEYNDDAVKSRNLSAGRRVGFIAQDVERVFPDWVASDADGFKYVTEQGTMALVVEALRDLRAEKDAQIDELRTQNQDLRSRLDALQAAVAELAAGRSTGGAK